MRTTALTSLLLPLLLASPSLAQEFSGEFDLDGRYSTRRTTSVKLTITKTEQGLAVSRTGRFKGRRFRTVAPFTWTSSDTKQAGRLLRVIYTLDEDGKSLGLLSQLDPDRDPGSATVTKVRKTSVLHGYYRISSDGQTLRELIVNTTRRSSEDWWYWVRTSGARTTPVAPASFVDQFRARGITDPSLYYHFGVQPSTLRGIADRQATTDLRNDPTDVTLRRIALVRAMIWENALRYRLDSEGRITVNGGGQWRVGTVTDASDGQTYDVVHWQDIDDNSFSFYWKAGVLYSIYYEN